MFGVFAGHVFSRVARNRPPLAVQSVPLCLKPERLAPRNSVGSAYTFGAGPRSRLSRVSFLSTVLLPERFRAISPSATACAVLSRKQVGLSHLSPRRAIHSPSATPCHLPATSKARGVDRRQRLRADIVLSWAQEYQIRSANIAA